MLKIFITFILIFFIQGVFAQTKNPAGKSECIEYQALYGLNIILCSDNKIILKSDNCNKLFHNANGLLSLSNNQLMTPASPPCTKNATSSGVISFQIELAGVLSDDLFNLLWNNGPSSKNGQRITGPNCWNFALYYSKIIKSLVYTDDNETEYWLKSPLCQQIKNSRDLMPGDIITYHHGFALDHAAIFVTQDLSFQKEHPFSDGKYVLSGTLQGIAFGFSSWDSADGCWIIDGSNENWRSLNCSLRYTQAYRCQSLNSYIMQFKTNNAEKEVFKIIDSIDDLNSAQIFSLSSNSADYSDKIEDYLQKIELILKKSNSQDFKFYEGIKLKINNIKEQHDVITGKRKPNRGLFN